MKFRFFVLMLVLVIIVPVAVMAQDDAAEGDMMVETEFVELPLVDPLDVFGDIITAGSSTVFPLSERMAEVFTDEGYIGQITIDSVGSGAGFERFCVAGESDITNASRAIRESEIQSCAAIARTPIEFRVGTDALVVVVSSDNDFVEALTFEDLALTFGEADTWADVNADWPDEPIERFIPGTDSGTFDFFVEIVFDEDETAILSANNTQFSEDDNVLVQGIQGSEFAIGFFGFAYFIENADTLKSIALQAPDAEEAVSPNADSAEDGSYPLSRPLLIYSDAVIIAEKPQVGAYINFYLTYVNEEIIDVGYFPASVEALNGARGALMDVIGE